MDLLQLNYFQVVAQEGSVTRASRRLHVSQPALSRMIRRLEEELGVDLFDRAGKSIVLNSSGEVFLRRVNTALDALSSGQMELRAMREGSYPDIHINAQAGVDSLIDLISSFNRKFPQIHLFIGKETNQSHFSDFVYDLTIKMQIADEETPDTAITLYDEELLLAVPAGHPLADRLHVDLKEVKKENFVLFNKKSTYRQAVEHYCAKAGFVPKVTAEGHDWRMICEFVRANMGVSIVPKHSWKSVLTGVTVIPIKEPQCGRKILLFWHSDERLTVSSRLFIEHASQYFNRSISG